MELPRELKRLIERYKAQYNIIGEDEDILKKVIPKLEDEDIIRLYDELCEEENENIARRRGYRPNFEKYREEILAYLDDSAVKSEIIKREQRQSSKPDLQQRNYTYISEFATTLDNKPDKIKIIRSFERKIKQLEDERELLDVDKAINNIDLSIHIYQCILHIREKMSIDLVLYRGAKFKKKYKMPSYIDLKKLKRKKQSKENLQNKIHITSLNQTIKRIASLKLEKELLRLQEIEEKEELIGYNER